MLARFWRFSKKVRGSILKLFQEGLGSILQVVQEGLGIDFLMICQLVGNPLFNNVSSMFKPSGHGSGWAGGVTRSAKNS